MKHRHKTRFVLALLLLGIACSLLATRLDQRVHVARFSDHSGRIAIPVRRQRPPQDTSVSSIANAPTPAPTTSSAPITRTAELAIKPISTHASAILKAKSYPINNYYALDTTPNDPYASQWPIATIAAPAAWDITTGQTSTVVAVLDTGFALDHEEFSGRWHTNPDESGMTTGADTCWTGVSADKATNSCDDDGNGYIDDWRGWDFFWGDNNPNTGSVTPTGSAVSHGTSVASLVGASANNSVGLAGLNWQTKIVPLQVLSDNGNGITYDVVAAIEYAVDLGVDVINMSLGSTVPDDALLAAVQYAESNNIVVIAAAGNCGHLPPTSCNTSAEPGNITYPAMYGEVVAVGALTQSNTRASFSSYGAALDVSAPGASLPYAAAWTAGNPTAAYTTGISGTSFAAPITSGLVSLLRGIDPTLSPGDIKAILADSTDRLSAMNGQYWTAEYGRGRINAFKAVLLTQVRALAFASGNVPSNGKKAPLLSFSTGTSVGTAVVASDEVLATCASYMGDNCMIELINTVSSEAVILSAQKTDAAGTAGWRFTAQDTGLSSGSWTARAHGNSLSSASVTFYVQ